MYAYVKSRTDVPIWVSCLIGDLEGVQSALANGQNVNDRSPGGVPGLMYACTRRHNGILDLMLVLMLKDGFQMLMLIKMFEGVAIS